MIFIVAGYKAKIKRMFVGYGLAPYTILIFILTTFGIYVPFGLILRNNYFKEYANTSTSIMFWKIIAFMSMLGPACYIFFTWIYMTVNIPLLFPITYLFLSKMLNLKDLKYHAIFQAGHPWKLAMKNKNESKDELKHHSTSES